MLVDPKRPNKHGVRCAKCDCPLTLLKVESWRWEGRRHCVRCLLPKGPTLLGQVFSQSERTGKKSSFRKALLALPITPPINARKQLSLFDPDENE